MAYPSIVDLRNYAKKYMFEDLQRKKLISEGKVDLTDLPEYKNALEANRGATDRAIESATSNMAKTGVTGPAAALTQERIGEAGLDSNLNLYNQLQQGLKAEGEAGVERARNTYNKAQDALGQKYLQPSSDPGFMGKFSNVMGIAKVAADPLQAVMPLFKSGGGGGGTPAGNSSVNSGAWEGGLPANFGSSGCCFIFRAGNDGVLEDPVRVFRDKYFAPDSNVSRGYKKMAVYLVPWMKKSRIVKGAVKLLMLNPLARVARWHEGADRLGWVFIPVGVFWCLIWGETGRVRRDILHSAGV